MQPSQTQKNVWIWVLVIAVIAIVGFFVWNANKHTSPNDSDTSGMSSETSGMKGENSNQNSGSNTFPTSGSTMILPYGKATLTLNQQGSFNGITMTPLSVTEDSRCMPNVQCIQAGTIKIVVKSVLDDGTTKTNTMTLGDTISVGEFSVGFVSVNPEHTNYQFTFDVHQNASGVNIQGKG